MRSTAKYRNNDWLKTDVWDRITEVSCDQFMCIYHCDISSSCSYLKADFQIRCTLAGI